MSRPQEIIAALIASSLTAAQLALLLELVSFMSNGLSSGLSIGSQVESPDDAIARRRKYDREYKAKRRLLAKLEAKQMSTGLSGGQVDTSCNLLPSSSLLPKSASKKDIQTSVVEGRRRGARLAADATLSDDDREFAVQLGVEPLQAWAEFKDYWIAVPGQRGTKLDWSATWRNRVRELAGRRKVRGNGKPTVHDAAKELTRRLAELDEPAPSGELFEQTGRNPLRLIPSR